MYELFDFDHENAVFEWDENKEAENFRKHGIKFKTAAKVFKDSKKLIREDEEHPEEERYNIIGRVGKVMFVVCVFKAESTVRLISARFATTAEKRRYENGESFYQ